MAELFSPIVICGQKVAAASRRGWQGIVFLWDFFLKYTHCFWVKFCKLIYHRESYTLFLNPITECTEACF